MRYVPEEPYLFFSSIAYGKGAKEENARSVWHGKRLPVNDGFHGAVSLEGSNATHKLKIAERT